MTAPAKRTKPPPKRTVEPPDTQEPNPGDPPAMPRERERRDPFADPRLPPQERPDR